MITVVKRPEGYVLDSVSNTATVSSSSGALFTKATHGLNTGDIIYIYSTLASYNGYWYVNVISANTFRVREYATASDIAFINSGTVTYFKNLLTHGWSCVHLPVIYKLKSDSWPINGADTAQTITTFSNYNGNTYINAGGDIKTVGTASTLEQVILTGTSVDGIYKILQWFSDTNFVINLPYSAGNVLSTGKVQYYYFNYCARIKIFAGLNASHFWAGQKPYVQLAEVKIVPDSTGIITLNISEILKSRISVLKNDTIKDTLPNNLDAFTQFYISVAESYDDSNMYTVAEFVSSYTQDTFEGYAVNAKLPFKTRSAGALSDYVNSITTLNKFLTPFARPTVSPGKYFDLSWINSYGQGLAIKKEYYLSSFAALINGDFTSTLSPWYNSNSAQGSGLILAGNRVWSVVSDQAQSLATTTIVTHALTQDINLAPGSYNVTITFSLTGGTGPSPASFGFYDAFGNAYWLFNGSGSPGENPVGATPQGFTVGNYVLTIPVNNAIAYTQIAFQQRGSASGVITWRIDSIKITSGTVVIDNIPDNGPGIYRSIIPVIGSETRIDVTVIGPVSQSLGSLSSFANQDIQPVSYFAAKAPGTAWTTGVAPSVTISGLNNGSKYLIASYKTIPGYTYQVNYNLDNGAGGAGVYFYFLNSLGKEVMTQLVSPDVSSSGVQSGSVNRIVNAVGVYIGIIIINSTGAANTTTINSLTITAVSPANISETKTIDVQTNCSFQDYYLGWLNYLGGYDYWNFTARKSYSVDVLQSQTTEKNIYSNYPALQGEFADSVTQQTVRSSKNLITATSQFLTTAQEDAIKLIVSSPLVQRIRSQYDRLTVIVDPSTLKVRRDQDKSKTLTIGVTYTEEIPSQTP